MLNDKQQKYAIRYLIYKQKSFFQNFFYIRALVKISLNFPQMKIYLEFQP